VSSRTNFSQELLPSLLKAKRIINKKFLGHYYLFFSIFIFFKKKLIYINNRRILTIHPPIPEELSVDVKDFICRLLVKDPLQRLGGGVTDSEELKKHPFFRVLLFTFNNKNSLFLMDFLNRF